MSGSNSQTPPAQAPSPPAPENHLPRGVQEAARRAEEAMRAQREGQQQQPAPAEPGIQVLTPQDQQPDPQPRNTQQENRQEEQRREAPPTEDLEHKYRSLEGRYKADMERLKAQADGLRDLLATVQAAQQAPKPDKDKPVETFSAGPDHQLTPDEERDYGPDMIGLIRKVATQVAYEVAGKVRSEVQKIEERVGSVQQVTNQTAHDRFINGLTESVPDWQTMNGDQEFLAWLAESDPFAGVPRQQLLNDAVDKKNAARAAAFFQGYKREQQTVSPQTTQPAASSPASRQGNGRVPLESLAAPGRAKPGASGAPQDKPMWTPQGITEFYEDVRKGKFRGREAEKERTEADLIAATREGRIMTT